MANCILCGAELVEGVCPNAEAHLKKMCLNCEFIKDGVCTNEDNMLAVKNKIMSTIQVPGGYELEEIKLKPVQLKNPTMKCGRWAVDADAITSAILKLAE